MESNNLNQQLGGGIYTIPEVAFILKLPVGKVRRWMTEFWDNKFSKKNSNKYSWGEGRDKATNFYTLIEFYVFYQLRALNISTNRIFKAHQDMAEQLNTAYPFASSKLLSDGKSILFTMKDGTIVEADNTRQAVFKQIIEQFCKKIEFSTTDIAERFYPLGKEKHIIVDPHHQFGQPVIEETNILAQTLYELYNAGETVAFLSRLYDLKEIDIQSAIELFTIKEAA
ncbi:DUF433 domain-containing protein [Pedobacter psychrodurus]|uniref:DUF433 domain-containing protein n=1 Tax=Pedobacter psychrodurus TaxID=2530456 RepID=A0A4R0PIZ0_9SPHI|nr:DUF433 domain-containing protein [Pedobacter psychrodurus]TCD19864.1 DUF433 domain-containing protein [Pedobacter psychrodurus]